MSASEDAIMHKTLRFQLAIALLTLTTTGFAQTAPRVAFEVASIREVSADAPSPSSLSVTQARVVMTNIRLRSLIPMAFGVEESLIAGPEWLKDGWENQRSFDIHASIPAGVGREHVPTMLRTLLAERFGLATHIEVREVPVYELTVHKDGLKMREVEAVDELAKKFPLDSGQKIIVDGTSTPLVARSLVTDNQERIIAATDAIRVVTARSMYLSTPTVRGTRLIDATRMTMVELASVLSQSTDRDRPVLDRTGLTGLYQFKIELPRVRSGLQRSGITTNRNGQPLGTDPAAGSISTAVQGLGLRLESRRSPLDVVVIDKLQQAPTPN